MRLPIASADAAAMSSVPSGAGWSPASIDRQPFSGRLAAVGVAGWIGLVCHLVVQPIDR